MKKSYSTAYAAFALATSITSYVNAGSPPEFTWIGGHSNNDMADPSNWTPSGGPPGGNEVAIFPTTANPPILSTVLTIGDLEFQTPQVQITVQEGGELETLNTLFSTGPFTTTFSIQPSSTLVFNHGTLISTGQFDVLLNNAIFSVEGSLNFESGGSLSVFMQQGSSLFCADDCFLLSLSSSSSLDNIVIDGVLTIENTQTDIIQGHISSSGSIIKQGPGLLILNGTNSYTGLTTVAQGSVEIDGSIPGNIVVENGTYLQGTGSIGGHCQVDAGATLAPGNPLGTFTINTVSLSDGSTTLITIDSFDSSQITALTNASLAGTLQIQQEQGAYCRKGRYTILTAPTITGQFSNLSGGFSGFSFSIEQTANAIFLDYTAQIPTEGLSGQALAVANYLNEHAPCSEEFAQLVQMQGNTLSQALNNVSPLRNSYSSFAAQQTLFSINEMITSHLGHKRLIQNTNHSSSSLASLLQSGKDLYADASYPERFHPSQSSKAPHELWVGGFAQSAKELKNANNPSFHFLSEGTMLGYDYSGLQESIWGGGLGYAHTYLSSHQYKTRASTQYYFGSLYGSYSYANFYVEPAFLAVFHHIHNHRAISYPGFHATAHSKINGWQIDPHLGIGYDFGMSWGEIEPFLSVDYAISWEGKYAEQGAGALNMRQKKHHSSFLRSETGLRVYENFVTSWGRWGSKQALSYLYKKPFGTTNVTSSITGSGAFFTINTLRQPENQGSVSLELFSEIGTQSPICLNASYVGEFGTKYLSNEWIFTIGKDF